MSDPETPLTAKKLYDAYAHGEGPIELSGLQYRAIMDWLDENLVSSRYDPETGEWKRIPTQLITSKRGHPLLFGREVIWTWE